MLRRIEFVRQPRMKSIIEAVRRELRFAGRTLWRLTRSLGAELWRLALFALAALLVFWVLGWP